MHSYLLNSSPRLRIARSVFAWSALLLLAILSSDLAVAQSLPSIDRRIWDADLYEVRSETDAPRTVLEPGTGKRKITGKRSIRGRQVRGKRSPRQSLGPKKSYRPQQFDRTTEARGRSERERTREPKQYSLQKTSKANAVVKKQTGKQAPDVHVAFGTLAASLERSVTQIVDQHGRSVLGTVVSTDGLIVSKNSLVDRNGRCIFSDGKQWPYRVIATDQRRDLCLIEVKRKPTFPVKFDDLPKAISPTVPGTISVSIGRNRTVAAWGVVTLPSYDFQIEQTERFELGALLSKFPVSSTGPITGVEVLRVSPRTLAEQMGLMVGDQIRHLNGQKIRTRDQIDTIVRKLQVGDLLTASTVDRFGRSKQISHRVSAKGNTSMHDRWGGGPYSKRRFGFGRTLVHDSVLNPENCGGPLVGLKGELLGVNIARSMRVASLAIASEDVLNFVKSHQPQAKLKLASREDAQLKLAHISKPNK